MTAGLIIARPSRGIVKIFPFAAAIADPVGAVREPPLRVTTTAPHRPFLRKQESIPGARGNAPSHLSPSGYPRQRGIYDVVPYVMDAPPSFLRKQESRAGARERPDPIPTLWVPASAGTDVGSSLYSRPPSFLRKQESIPGARGKPRPTSPLWVPASAGTTTFHRLSCEACPRGNGEQESIPGARGKPRPISPLWVPASAGTTTPPPPPQTRSGPLLVGRGPLFRLPLSRWLRGLGGATASGLSHSWRIPGNPCPLPH